MKLKKDSWHYKVYSWFKGYEPLNGNLCPYIRTVFIWAPLKWLLGTGRIGKIPTAAITLPSMITSVPVLAYIYHGPVRQILIFYGTVIGFLALISILVFIIVWLEENGNDMAGNVSSLIKGSLVGKYIQAKHDKICPTINFE